MAPTEPGLDDGARRVSAVVQTIAPRVLVEPDHLSCSGAVGPREDSWTLGPGPAPHPSSPAPLDVSPRGNGEREQTEALHHFVQSLLTLDADHDLPIPVSVQDASNEIVGEAALP